MRMDDTNNLSIKDYVSLLVRLKKKNIAKEVFRAAETWAFVQDITFQNMTAVAATGKVQYL